MAPSEGAREIEAAQKRLAAAKARASADATALDSARGVAASAKKVATLAEKKVSAAERALAAAREMAELSKKTAEAAAKTSKGVEARAKESKKEAKEAKKMLKEAEDRWEVVAVHESDSESEASEEGGSRKKQKTSDGANEVIHDDDVEEIAMKDGGGGSPGDEARKSDDVPQSTSAHIDPDEVKEGDRVLIKHGEGLCRATIMERHEKDGHVGFRIHYYDTKRKEKTSDYPWVDCTRVASFIRRHIAVEEIIVEGAGAAEINGAYKQDGVMHDYPTYQKECELSGEVQRFILFRGSTNWVICGINQANRRARLYYKNRGSCADSAGTDLPPKTGWQKWIVGASPAPKLKW